MSFIPQKIYPEKYEKVVDRLLSAQMNEFISFCSENRTFLPLLCYFGDNLEIFLLMMIFQQSKNVSIKKIIT